MCSRNSRIDLILKLAKESYNNVEHDVLPECYTENRHSEKTKTIVHEQDQINYDQREYVIDIERDVLPGCSPENRNSEKTSTDNKHKQINEEPDVYDDPYAANSDIDPDYQPSEEEYINETSAEDVENSAQPVITKNKRKESNIKQVGRKRARNISEWIDKKSKTSQDLGLEHENRKGVKIKGRQLGEQCKDTCRLRCSTKISQEDRELIFNEFWQLKDHTRQWYFVARHVRQIAKKQVTVTVTAESQSRRNYSREYHFNIRSEEIRICKVMFLKTLDISETWVTTALSKVKKGGTLEEDKRGKHSTRPQKLELDITESIKNHIKQFPVVPSHYIRKNSERMYFEEGLSIQKMYRLYTENCEQNNIIKVATPRKYRDIFNKEFNIGFFKPKKDQCEVCSVFSIDPEAEKEKMLEKYERYLKNKTTARDLKNSDKDIAVNDKSVCVACFDLQKVLATPQSNVSDFYYKSKYSTYNFTIYDLGNNKGFCYVWHEQIAKRGPNEIASCLWKFLNLQTRKGVKKVIFYSDNCGGQNRNRFIFSMFAFAAVHFQIDITHRFLEKGHMQNEGDSMHAVIENAKKRQSVLYVPEQWVTLIRMAKTTGKVYDVTEMSQDDFFNFKILTDTENWKVDIDKNPIKVSQIRDIRFSYEKPNTILFKYEFDADLKSSDLKKRRGRPASINKQFPPKLYKLLAIDDKKLKGLLWLCNTNKIPTMYHAFYKSLISKTEDTQPEEAEGEDYEKESD